MNRTRLLAVLIASLPLGGTLSLLRGEAPSPSIEQQLQAQYRLSSLDANGAVTQFGTVLVVAQAGIKATPPSAAGTWYDSHKPGGGIKYSRVAEALMPPDLTSQVRLLVVGAKVVILRLDIKPSEVIFYVQTATIGVEGAVYRAAVFFQFPQKNFVQPANLKAIQDSIAEVFSIDTSKPEALVPARAPGTPGGPQIAGPSLDQVAGLYLMAQAPANHLQLNSDGTLALFQGGQNYSGVFTIEGNRIVGRIGTGPQQQTGVLQGDTIVDPNGSVWVKQKAAPPAAVSLRLPSTYVNAQADQLRLNADNSFSLQASGETYHGTFVVSGNTVELSIRETGDKTTATIQANNNLTDSNGQAWVLREQSADSAPDGPALKNEDIIKLAKAGLDDELIIAKINGSKCQFDTSTDALIQLKKSGVSATVLKAIVGTGK
jgi:hypothetical protein